MSSPEAHGGRSTKVYRSSADDDLGPRRLVPATLPILPSERGDGPSISINLHLAWRTNQEHRIMSGQNHSGHPLFGPCGILRPSLGKDFFQPSAMILSLMILFSTPVDLSV